MTGIIECYKRIYANKKIHIQLLIIAIVWSILSNLLDIKTGNSLRQNIIDLIFNIFIGAYSLQFLHNSVNNFNNFRLPSFKEIKPKIYLDMIKLNIVWGIYAILCMLFVVFTYMMFHKLILPVIVTGVILFVSVFVYYIYLAYAESLNTKGLYNIRLLFLFIKPAFKQTYKKLILFMLFTFAAAFVCIILYTVLGYLGMLATGYIKDGFYILDIIMYAFACYFIMVTWYLAFPYSLINTYKEVIKPILGKDTNNNGEHA